MGSRGNEISSQNKRENQCLIQKQSNIRLAYTKNAEYTVEAALILPLVFLLVFLIIEIAFFCYDRTRLQAILNDVTRRAAQYITYDINLKSGIADNQHRGLFAAVVEADEGKKEEIERYCSERLSSRMILSEIEEIKVDASITKLKITVEMNTKLLFGLWIPQIMSDGINISLTQSAELFPREEKTRIVEAVFSLGNRIKGVSEGLDRIRELIN